MATIKLTDTGYTLIPEGVHVFKITEVEYDEDFGKMVITMQTQEGQKHFERFSLLKANGEVNEGAIKAFSFFAKSALNNFDLEEIDEQDLVNCYISATVKHEPYDYTNKNGEHKSGTSERLNNYQPALGFSNAETEDLGDDEDDWLNA